MDQGVALRKVVCLLNEKPVPPEFVDVGPDPGFAVKEAGVVRKDEAAIAVVVDCDVPPGDEVIAGGVFVATPP